LPTVSRMGNGAPETAVHVPDQACILVLRVYADHDFEI